MQRNNQRRDQYQSNSRSGDFSDLAMMVNAAIQPVLEHINKIELMSREQVTRADLTGLQTRLEGALERVSKDTYPREILDQRRAAYDERLINLTAMVNGNRQEANEAVKRLQQELEKQDTDAIGTQERGFLRLGFVISSIIGGGGFLIAAINFLGQHFH